MRLGFGIGVTARQPTRRSATLAGLFTTGTKGFFYDSSQLSSLFQDVAGTIPVTAAGQAVARINDLSGLGNHALQPTTFARPVYQTDGTRHWLAFDGVDDHLLTPSINWASLNVTIATGIRKTVDTRATILDGVGAPRFTIEAPGPSGGDFAAFLWSTLAVNATARIPAPAPTSAVLMSSFDMTTRVVQMALNAGTPVSATAASGSGVFADGVCAIGRRTGSSQFLNGRLFGLVAISRVLTPGETSQANTFLNARTGAY